MITITNPMVVDLDRFDKMRARFVKHYFLDSCDPNFGGQEIQVSWNSFSLAITGFISSNEVDPETIAIRFVHCYDTGQKVLYERMQIVTLALSKSATQRVYPISDTPCEWYELSNSTITPTTDTDLFDMDYLESFYYCRAKVCSAQTSECLADDTEAVKYARTVTVPWVELVALYEDNFSPSNATLCIDAGCRCSKKVPAVKYQHTLMFYLRDEYGLPLLNNEQGEYAFTNKAADFGTLCPNQCGVYVQPVGGVKGDDFEDEDDIDDDEDEDDDDENEGRNTPLP